MQNFKVKLYLNGRNRFPFVKSFGTTADLPNKKSSIPKIVKFDIGKLKPPIDNRGISPTDALATA